jgi:carbamoyl-phosphate synthase large subunit
MSDISMLKDVKSFDVEVITTDTDDKDSSGFLLTGKKYIVPKVKDSKYIEKMLDICKSESITTIIPQYTDELLPLSENIHRFRDLGVEILVTEDVEKLKIANNKSKLYQFFNNSTFVPIYKTASDIASVKAAALKLGYPDVPICIRPVQGEGGNGFRILTEERFDIFNEPNSSNKMNLDTYINQLKNLDKIPDLVVSEYLPGKEYSVDCVCKNGKPYICIPRQRLETSMGVATVALVEKKDDLINYSNEIIESLNLSYNINIQFKYSNDGKAKLLEINPRVSGSLVANYGAGINMLESSLKLAYGIPVEKPNIKWGTKMVRHYDQTYTQV